MKKTIISICVLVILIVGVKFFPLGTKSARLGATLISIEVPKLSTLEYEYGEYNAKFKSFRSKSVIEKELNKIMSKYQKVFCNNETYYYDRINNITYKNYVVKGSLISTEYTITYVRNNICEH